MTAEQSRSNRALVPENPWLPPIAASAVGAAFFSLWFWLLPGWLGFRVETPGASHWRWLAAIPSVLGFAVALRCVWDFGWTGHGTPAPVAPPQRLVVVGFYRYVRNPMYVGLRNGMDRLVDRFRPRQRGRDCDRSGRRCWRSSLRGPLRRAHPAQEVRRRLSRLLPKRTPLVAALATLE